MLIFLLVSAGMASGVQFAFNQYSKALRISESHVLYSTLQVVIGDELRYTEIIKTDDTGKVTEYQGSSAYRSKYGEGSSLISVDEDGNYLGEGAFGQIAYGQTSGTAETSRKKLLSDAAYTRDLTARVSSVTYDEDNCYFTVKLEIGYKDETLISEEFNVYNVPRTIPNK